MWFLEKCRHDHCSFESDAFKHCLICVCSKKASSETNDFPALPDGTLNKFLCQWTTSLYTLQIALVYVTPSKFPHIKLATGNGG